MRVLLFGGSFDPPHAGHLRLLKTGLRTLRPDRAFLVPAFRSPFKPGHGAPPAERAALTRELLRDGRLEGVRVDRFELDRGGRSFTYQLLRVMRARHPGAEFWFLCGSDSAATLASWKRSRELRQGASWLVGLRPGAPFPKLPGFRVKRLPGVFPDVSSTALRARLLAGDSGAPWLTPGVARRIRRRGLYGAAMRRELAATLSPRRYEHTLGVASLAQRLAARHGLDPEAAALAGLLHDSGRRFDPAALARYARKRDLRVPARAAIERNAPLLLHAYVSADLARRRFGVSDPEVLSAIARHTLGARRMSSFDRLLYVADIASEDRGFRHAAAIRREAFRDLDAAFRRAVSVKLEHVRSMGGWMHPLGPALARLA